MPGQSLHFKHQFESLSGNVERLIRGKSETVRLALVCLFAEGHLLIEDVPGVAKTSLARSIAASIDGTFHRVQFTPDLLPADITGVEIYNQKEGEFEFRAGPIFGNVVLGDEINRASAKTQSALLQAMAEGEVTAGRRTYRLPRPFFCLATQNPVDYQGTYPLPEAQLDRFMMRVSMGYPPAVEETSIIAQALAGVTPAQIRPVISGDEVSAMVMLAREVEVNPPLLDYVVAIAEATRRHPDVRLGASPRGSIALAAAARVWAASKGRAYAIADDVKDVAIPVLAHRLLLKQDARRQGNTAEKVISEVLHNADVPGRVPLR
ncbi:AAA family ATPase [Phytohabitans aurantiacus]|uniref:MoxR-like ATPase n=1 Tax=Phytohabitans aurantiacus TaxID=3016789 RepID=A0ABQ5R3Z1_9ACTN|nr:MoxR family ATPase [Phytohabitans aurantiacus]GLI01048.1 MoxR-like ATPase [Phytohabitans aurantiacus]